MERSQVQVLDRAPKKSICSSFRRVYSKEKMEKIKKKRILVGLSGGVDSSVSALLLKKQGYEIEGAFMMPFIPEWLTCSAKDERLDALRIASFLDIPFHTVDLSSVYKKEVVDYFVESYKKGMTPNPDCMCNKYVKFGAFWDYAKKNNFDAIATGHYAQIKEEGGEFFLYKGRDEKKDQSYFLCTIPKEILEYIYFPVGHLKKEEVRSIAKENNLSTAEKKESQGVCFLGNIDMPDFLSHYFKKEKGKVLDTEGNSIGFHYGARFFTLGQRHNFTIEDKNTEREKMYVIEKDISSNTLIVAREKEREEKKKVSSVFIEECEWLIKKIPEKGSVFSARFRYRQKLFKSTILFIEGTTAHISFENPQEFIAEGQMLVLYEKEKCIGGGIIVEKKSTI